MQNVNIKEEIQKLIDLQKIDSRILALKRERDAEKPQQVKELKDKFDSEKSVLTSYEEELKNIQLRKKERELDLQTKEEAARKAQGQLYQLKTNQEYHAKMKEIESLKADVSVLEEDILGILEEVDNKVKELSEQKKVVEEKEKKFNEEKKRIEEEVKELDIKIKSLEDKRGILTKNINPKALSRYEHLLQAKHGLALVPLKGGSCGGCYLNLPPEMINRVKHYSQIIQCEMCARMLYLEEDFTV